VHNSWSHSGATDHDLSYNDYYRVQKPFWSSLRAVKRRLVLMKIKMRRISHRSFHIQLGFSTERRTRKKDKRHSSQRDGGSGTGTLCRRHDGQRTRRHLGRLVGHRRRMVRLPLLIKIILSQEHTVYEYHDLLHSLLFQTGYLKMWNSTTDKRQ
jgi:hypothetical protein